MTMVKMLDYDQLHDYLTSSAVIEQELAEDYGETGDGPDWDQANRHWGKADAYREMTRYIERELESVSWVSHG